MLDEHVTYIGYSDAPRFGCKEQVLLHVPQVRMGSIPPFSCFVHNKGCLASYSVWKKNLTNKYRLSKRNSVGLRLETSPTSRYWEGERWWRGEAWPFVLHSEVCSLQAAPLQMQQQEPCLAPRTPRAAVLHSHGAWFLYQLFTLRSIHPHQPVRQPRGRTRAYFTGTWILYTRPS